MNRPDNLPPVIETSPWMLADGGALDVDECPDCWERRAHIERYVYACRAFVGMDVMDFGCGVGYGAEMLAAAGNRVTAVDSSVEALQIAKLRRAHLPIDFLDHIPGRHKFDAVVALEVVEHLDDPAKFINRIWARHLLVSVPVRPTVGANPHHRNDFTLDGFTALLEQHWQVTVRWIQVEPFHDAPSIGVWLCKERA